MSFSLSSLLNPEPSQAQPEPPHLSPSQQRRDSLPPIQHVQSPEQHYATVASSQLAPPQSPHHPYHRGTAQEAAQTLASLSSNHAPPPPTQWYGQNASGYAQDERRKSSEHRPSSSGYGAPIELPPPSNTRKMSSPTLDQYHVTSRSPEQRRPSMAPPAQSGFTLPPMQSFGTEQQRRPSITQSPILAHHDSHAIDDSERQPADAAQIGPLDTTQQESNQSQTDATSSEDKAPPSSTPLVTSTLDTTAEMDAISSSPAKIKQEPVHTSQASSPIDARRSSVQHSDTDSSTLKAVAALKNEHSLRMQSPLRESSVPVPSTEMSAPEQTAPSKKRPAPSKTKKGTATMTKKAPPSKKRKVEPKRSATPSSLASKPTAFRTGSSKGTPANSSPAPSNRSYSAEPNDDPYDDDEDPDEDVEGSGDVYCICRKPDNGTFMIGCDGTCDDWFHGRCVGIEERNKNLIDKYMCPACTKAGIGRTTWKRMCRRSGCRQPARLGKSKGGKDGSKYCSEECGVLYFREMVARTRGREDMLKNRSSRRKSSIVSTERPSMDDDLGARGGVLAASEVKGLLESSKTAEDFKKLGEGVLSPPATPDGKDKKEHEYTEEETLTLARIHRQKDDARRRHQLLKDRMKFVTMAKQAASRIATEKELKPKEYCGYDPRLEWTEEQFKSWRESAVGKQAFELETLAVEKSSSDEQMDAGEDEDADVELCDRKKCARHLEWGKLTVDGIRFEMGDNSDNMRALDREEKEVKERAALRSKAANIHGAGSVEVHGLGIMNGDTGEKMVVDVLVPEVLEKAVVETVEPVAPMTADTEAMEVDQVA